MGAVLRKPVVFQEWDSLVSEANRLYESCSLFVGEARRNGTTRILKQRFSSVQTQGHMLVRIINTHLTQAPQTKETLRKRDWFVNWWTLMEEKIHEFKILKNQNLEPIKELEEPLLP
jgi:hypothetical protein